MGVATGDGETAGDPRRADELLGIVYEELRQLARARLRGMAGSTLPPTALVHEAYMRLRSEGWNGPEHFFAAAAHAMRCILIDRARARARLRHGGDQVIVHLENWDDVAGDDGCPTRLLALDEALERLAASHPDHARVVELRFFAGLSTEEIADMSGLSSRTVERRWRLARAWLHRELRPSDAAASEAHGR